MKRKDCSIGMDVRFRGETCQISRMLGYKVFVVDSTGYEDLVSPRSLKPIQVEEVKEKTVQGSGELVLVYEPDPIRGELLELGRRDSRDSGWTFADYAAASIFFGVTSIAHVLIAVFA